MMTHVAVAAYDAASSRAVDLSGHWKLNAALSDDPEQMLQERLEKESKRRAASQRRERAQDGRLIPLDSLDPESVSANASRDRLRKRRDDELRKMLGVSPTLDITQTGARIDITSQVDARRFQAGSRSQVSMPQGELADSAVGWDGDWFVIDRKVRGGPRVLEKYRWLKKTDQLESYLAWSGGDGPLAGMKVKRIYDRAVGEVAPPDPASGPVR